MMQNAIQQPPGGPETRADFEAAQNLMSPDAVTRKAAVDRLTARGIYDPQLSDEANSYAIRQLYEPVAIPPRVQQELDRVASLSDLMQGAVEQDQSDPYLIRQRAAMAQRRPQQ